MEEGNTKRVHKDNVHWVLAHSYAMQFALFLVGVALDLVFRIKIFSDSVMIPAGSVLIVISTILIIWAEHTARNLKKDNLSKEAFCRGPYCYTRTPVHWGLFFLMLGFGITINAFFVIVSTIISFTLAKLIFQSREEKLLEQKYGEHYAEYKKLVRF